MNICIFPGTFNPIHQAHIRVAEFALDFYKFDKIIFIPAFIPPHKKIDLNLAKHRFNMVKLATKDNAKFEVSDIEYMNQGKSYSLLTVKEIMKQYNIKGKINFIIGTDAFDNIDNWYKANELRSLVHFIVFPRGVNISEKKLWDYEIAPMEFLDISSTKIRKTHDDAIKDVKDYIEQNDLYA